MFFELLARLLTQAYRYVTIGKVKDRDRLESLTAATLSPPGSLG